MGAKFLVRFDDICPMMNWTVWESVERILDEWSVKPIIAVVPDNKDPKLVAEPARGDFWDIVRRWQRKGWTIGWHGYQHVYTSRSAGIVGIHKGSEFAGESEGVQRCRLEAARQIFREQRVTPDVWVAPGHSFDGVTVKLLAEFGVSIISDGHFLGAIKYDECIWVPQQLWRFRDMPSGLWTVCHHHDAWTAKDVARFAVDLERFHERITSLPDVLDGDMREFGLRDRMIAAGIRGLILARQRLRGIAAS